MIVIQHAEAWYIAKWTFPTKYGTNATACGYGRTEEQARNDCMQDKALIERL